MRLTKKTWLLGGLIAGGIASVIVLRRTSGSHDDDDWINAAGEGDAFGDRDATAPEQRWSPVQTEKNVAAEELSMAARVETSWNRIHEVWPALTLDDIRPAEGDLDKLAGLIAEKAEQPRDEVRDRLEAIIAEETPMPSFPAQ
ncbi:MAG: CsbD family protein [Dehalococcoidia bacterium]